MKKTNNAAAAAKVAAADNKTNNAANLDRAAILNAAKDAAKGCNTCSQVAAKFDALCAKFGKDAAKEIQSAAKEIIKSGNQSTKDAAKDAREFLGDGEKVAVAAWRALLDSDRKGAQFARVVYEANGCKLAALVSRFASYVSEDAEGHAVAVVRVVSKDAEGARVEGYKPRNLATVGGYLAALKLALNNAKRAALGTPRDKWQTTVAPALVEWPAAEVANS